VVVGVVANEVQREGFWDAELGARVPPPYDVVVLPEPRVYDGRALAARVQAMLKPGGVLVLRYEAHCARGAPDAALAYVGCFGVGEGAGAEVYVVAAHSATALDDAARLYRGATNRDARNETLLRAVARHHTVGASVEAVVRGLAARMRGHTKSGV